MFHVPCINRVYKIYKKTNQCSWIYECNFIPQQSLTCFGYSCDHPQGIFVLSTMKKVTRMAEISRWLLSNKIKFIYPSAFCVFLKNFTQFWCCCQCLSLPSCLFLADSSQIICCIRATHPKGSTPDRGRICFKASWPGLGPAKPPIQKAPAWREVATK